MLFSLCVYDKSYEVYAMICLYMRRERSTVNCISKDCDCDDLFVRDIQIEEEMVLAEEKIQEEGGEQQ